MREERKFDFEFQNKVIVLMTINEDFLRKYGPIVKPEYFTDETHQFLCEVINSYWEKYKATPTQEYLFEEISKVEDTDSKQLLLTALEEIMQTATADLGYYTDKTLDFCKTQALVLALKGVVSDVKKGEYSAVIPKLETALSVGTLFDETNLGTSFWDTWLEPDLLTEAPRIPTLLGPPGKGGLDDFMGGGLEVENVGLVMMPTGKGKSAFLVNMAANGVIGGYNVIYYIFELTEKSIAKRFRARFSGIPQSRLSEHSTEEIKKSFSRQFAKNWNFGKLLIKNFPVKTATVRDLENHLRTVREKLNWAPSLVCIDHLENCQAPFRDKKDYEQLQDIALEIKAMAQRHQIPIWTGTQVNTTGARKKIIESVDSSGSYGKTFNIDVIVTGSPRFDEKTGQRRVRFFIAKNRQGPSDITLNFKVDFDVMTFEMCEESDLEVGGSVESVLESFKSGMRGR